MFPVLSAELWLFRGNGSWERVAVGLVMYRILGARAKVSAWGRVMKWACLERIAVCGVGWNEAIFEFIAASDWV